MNDRTAIAGHIVGAALLAFSVSAGGAQAVPPACALVGQELRMSDGFDAVPASFHAVVTVEDLGNGFAGWGLYANDGPERYVLQNCNSGNELIVDAPADVLPGASILYEEMIYGDRSFTLRQIATAMRRLGAEAEMTRNTQGDCACRTLMLTE